MLPTSPPLPLRCVVSLLIDKCDRYDHQKAVNGGGNDDDDDDCGGGDGDDGDDGDDSSPTQREQPGLLPYLPPSLYPGGCNSKTIRKSPWYHLQFHGSRLATPESRRRDIMMIFPLFVQASRHRLHIHTYKCTSVDASYLFQVSSYFT